MQSLCLKKIYSNWVDVILRAKNYHATKVIFTQNEYMWFWWHDYFASKNHIIPVWVDVSYLSAGLLDRGLYLCPQDYVSLGIPARIFDWIFSRRAKNILMVGTFSNSWNWKNQWREKIWTGGNVFRIGGKTYFTMGKIKFRWKFRSSKGLELD